METKSDKNPFVLLNENKNPICFFLTASKGPKGLCFLNVSHSYKNGGVSAVGAGFSHNYVTE